MSESTRFTELEEYLQEIATPFFALADVMDLADDAGSAPNYPPSHVAKALAEWARWKLKSTADAIGRDVGAIEIEHHDTSFENREEGRAGLVCGAKIKPGAPRS